MSEPQLVDRRTGETIDTTSKNGMQRALADQRAEINTLTDDIRELTDAVAALADQLTARHGTGRPGAAAPWCWQALDEAAAAELWRQLTDWVAWLRSRYPIAEQLPPCWAQHPELVEEFTALHAVWTAAYRDPTAPPTAPADFHDRWLPGTLTRIRTWGVHCTDTHRDRPADLYANSSALRCSRPDTPFLLADFRPGQNGE